jgi:hypothetical protein
MGRAWRIEYDGAFYHILSRGNERKDIFLDDKDRRTFLSVIGEYQNPARQSIKSHAVAGRHLHQTIQ